MDAKEHTERSATWAKHYTERQRLAVRRRLDALGSEATVTELARIGLVNRAWLTRFLLHGDNITLDFLGRVDYGLTLLERRRRKRMQRQASSAAK